MLNFSDYISLNQHGDIEFYELMVVALPLINWHRLHLNRLANQQRCPQRDLAAGMDPRGQDKQSHQRLIAGI